MDIKELQELVKWNIEVTDNELDDIDKYYTKFIDDINKVESTSTLSKWNTVENINEYGYRSDNFDGGGDGFMFLGCSLTEGYALEQEETWPWIVGKHFDIKVWNLAKGGAGDDLCFMNALTWISKLKPKAVCMLIPSPGRFKFFDYNREKLHKEFFLYGLPKKPKFPWLFNPKHLYLSALKNIMGIKLICDEYDIPFVIKSPTTFSWVDTARDNKHPGPKWQKKVSKLFIKELQKYF